MTLAYLANALVTEPAKRQGIDELVAIKAGVADKSGHTVGPDLVAWLNARVAHLAPFDHHVRVWVTPASGGPERARS